MKYWMVCGVWLVLAACAAKPPVQEMAEARSSVQLAKELAQDQPMPLLQSAEKALQEASEAIRQQRYEHARLQAIKARRNAQRVVKKIQKNNE